MRLPKKIIQKADKRFIDLGITAQVIVMYQLPMVGAMNPLFDFFLKELSA